MKEASKKPGNRQAVTSMRKRVERIVADDKTSRLDEAVMNAKWGDTWDNPFPRMRR
jgi:hypothetical protein